MRKARLDQVCTKIGSGATPRGGEAVYATEGVALIRSQNVLDSSMKTEGIARITDEAARALGAVAVAPSDVLLNITGESVARCCLVDPRILPARVNQHVMIVRPGEGVDSRFLQSYLVSPSVKSDLLAMSSGGTRRALTKAQVGALEIPVPPPSEQRAIAEVLGALDDKISANDTVRNLVTDLVSASYRASLTAGYHVATISSVCRLVSRGASPRYSDDAEATLVLNQKCVRNGDVDLRPARRTEPAAMRPGTLLQRNDVLVNSTGVGTLGRVARWVRADVATVDSHITILRPDPGAVDPATFGVAVMEMQSEIEGLAEGSTGQTELSRQQLGSLSVRLPDLPRQDALEALIGALSERSLAAAEESVRLAALRDALLPELISGRLRVKDAEKSVEEVI